MHKTEKNLLPPLRQSWNNNFAHSNRENDSNECHSPSNPKTYKEMTKEVKEQVEKIRRIGPLFQS